MKPSQDRGSILITAAVAAAILSILIGGFLTFISNEYALNLRSHSWNQALHVAEAGVETAFAEFNYYYTKGGGFSSLRGWSAMGSGEYLRSVGSFYDNDGRNLGSMYSWVHGVGTSSPWVSGYGYCLTTPRGPAVWRRVDVVLKGSFRFPAGLVAKRTIDMNGNNVTTDSFDSTDPSKSTLGLYDVNKKQPNGDVASNDTITNTVDVSVGNANIHGKIMVSPSGSVTMGPNGEIGPDFTNPAHTVAEARANGWLRNDFQVDIPDTSLPVGAASWPALTGSETITSGDYKGSQISGSRTISGNVRIYLTGDNKSITLTGNEAITITAGSSLTIYVDGEVDAAGNGIVNVSGTPLNCQLFGTTSCTSVKITGNGEWVGTVYAPQAAAELKGGGNSGYMSGAIVADTIKFTGNAWFHYDESLGRIGPKAGYNMASWKSYRYDASNGTWVSD